MLPRVLCVPARWVLRVGGLVAMLALCHPSGADEIELTARAINSSLLTGEPLILSVTVRSDAPIVVPFDLTPSHLRLRVLVDRGDGFVPYVEYALVEKDNLSGPGRIPAGVTREFVLGIDKSTHDWTFPIPGTYRLVAEYSAPDGPAVRSNVVTVSVHSPAGAEGEVYNALRQLGPGLVVAQSPEYLEESLEALVLQYPGSAYLQERRLRDLAARIGDVRNGYEPEHVAQAGTPENPPPGPDMRPETVAARARDLLPLALDVSSVAGPFQPNGLLTLAELYNIAGQPERASEVYERVAGEFPEREAGRIARGVVRDHVPPTLRVLASPGSLWPPNHKLVAISTAVTMSDDVDPSPTVALKSITCDDSCDPAQDIGGAELGTDDREFELRADRKGSGSGRTYTITYSAMDASGNEATAVTTVMVPHDQGKK